MVEAPPRQTSAPSATRVLGVLGIAVVGFAIQQTAVVPAVPTIEQSLHGSKEWSAWLVTVYLAVATVATPAMGRLADLHGRRRMLLIGLGVFVAGSIAAAFAPNMAGLLCCRAVQGVGGSVYPLCLAIAREQLPRERVTAGVAVLAGSFGVGTAIGFLAGGLLAQYASWRWIFATGAVVVAVALVQVRRMPSGDTRAHGTFDLPGTALLSIAVIGLLTALTLVVPNGWAAMSTIALLALAAIAGIAWLRVDTTRADPLIDVHVLREPRVVMANLAAIGLGWALFSSYLLIPGVVQHDPAQGGFGLGGGAALTGFLLLPLAVGQSAAAPLAGRLSPRLGPRMLCAAGMALIAAGFLVLALTRGSPASLAVASGVLGIGAGLAIQASSDIATQEVEADVAAVSSALNSTVRRLGGGIGGQVATMIVTVESRAAFVAAYAVAGALSLLGAVLLGVTRAGR